MLTGITAPGAAADDLPDGALRLARLTLPATQRVVRVGAFLDGDGAGFGSQRLRPVIYTAAGELVAAGAELELADTAAAGWETLRFDRPGFEVVAGDYYVGLHAGATANALRLYRGAAGALRYTATDSYGDGAPAVLPALGNAAGPLSILLETMGTLEIPDDVEDLYLAQLPFEVAQRVLGATGPVPRSAVLARCGWHGLTVDDVEGSVAIVRTGGPLEALVGERIRVTRRVGSAEQVVYAYVHNEQDWPDEVDDEDFSLQRRPFLELATWGEGVVDVTVEVLTGVSSGG
jgi:hypothetical protein